MAALCPGVQYGLSSQESFGENKDLIFVKLTDSAIRAIEEYLRNKNKFSCPSPTIKFLGNEGQLGFPSAGSTASFSFSMSSTQDMEGPGGSFECLRQTGPPRGSLEVLGSIPYKIRVHANDDVYAATRQRMTVAEENHKNKCTREIKPNQTDIGRKVKVKQMMNGNGRPIPPIPPRSISSNSNEKSTQPHPSMRDSLLKTSCYPSPNDPSKQPCMVNSTSNSTSNGLRSNHVSSTRPQNKPITPDILKRPIKERLIHLLALKPFKKIEIFERLTKEGLRERGNMSKVLKQIATMKDNAYHLNRACWHDVRENWPFYTESEKQILKRRKPQNLTPPGSSDSGSSGSGQSPTSTHPGSPPPPVVTTSSKRPGYYDGADGFPTKRQRVSHYRKPPEPTVNPPPVENKSQRRPVTDSRDSSNMNPRSRESPSIITTTTLTNHEPTTNGVHIDNGYSNGRLKDKRGRLSEDEDDSFSSKKRMCDSYNGIGFDVKRETTDRSPYANDYDDKRDSNHFQPMEKFHDGGLKDATYHNGDHHNGDDYHHSERWMNDEVEPKRDSLPSYIDIAAVEITRVSPDSQSEPLLPVEPTPVKNNILSTFPDYVTEYTTIKNYEQRKRYKSDFNDNYAEYKDLHGIVEKVSRRFAELEERLKQEDIKSPRYKDIKKQIMKEYKENKKNIEHQKAKLRFQYLHDKLSHIKKLVKQYDKTILNQQYQNDQY